MKKDFSTAWKASKQRRKQRKYAANAPLHIKRKFLHVHLSKDLRAKYQKRAVQVRKGDRVKVMRGQHYGKTGKIELVNTKYGRVYIEGVEKTRRDGSKSKYPFQPSNLMIMDLTLDDKRRVESINRRVQNQPAEAKKK